MTGSCAGGDASLEKQGNDMFHNKAAIFASLGISALVTLSAAHAQEEAFEFNLSWLPQGSTAGVIVAAHEGYYEEEGLDVTPVRGFGGLRTVNEIDQGMFKFGYGNPDGIVVNRASGGNVRMVGAINATNPGGICFVNERHNLTSLEDMKGLKLGGAAGTPVNVTFPALLSANGLPADHVEIVQLQGSVVTAALIDGQIDIYECWRGSGKPLLESQAKQAGLTIGFVPYEAMGQEFIGSGIATTDEIIENNPELVEKVLRATYKGYQFLQDNPEKGADIVVEMFPEVNREAVLAQINDINELIMGPGVEENGMGYIDPTRVTALVEFIGEANELASPVSADDVYTNQFIKK